MKNSQRGSALILVLWCVLVLSISILAAARLIEWGIAGQRIDSRRFDAKQLALTGIAYGCDPKIEKMDPLLNQEFGSKKKLRVLVGSEGGRININRLLAREDYSVLADLFKQWGLGESEVATLTDCLKDWVDPDDLRSLYGAERRDLQGGVFSLPENRPFLAVAEMRAVKGWEILEQIKPDWADSFSVLSGDRLDLQETTAELLIVFGKLTRHQAESFVAYRNGLDRKPDTLDDIKIEAVENVAAIVGLSEFQQNVVARNFQVGGSPVRVTSTGFVGDMQYTVIAVMATRGKEAPFLWWEEK